jgi:hypothetical protein
VCDHFNKGVRCGLADADAEALEAKSESLAVHQAGTPTIHGGMYRKAPSSFMNK